MTTSIIADASGLISLISKEDRNHKIAQKISESLCNKFGNIIIPGEIFAETLNVISKKIGRVLAVKTGRNILDSKVYSINETSPSTRLKTLKKFSEQSQSVSFTDCLVMAVADEYITKDIFGFDETFKKNGYKRLGIDK